MGFAGWLVPVLVNLGMGAGEVVSSVTPGGTFRRPAATWDRTFDRSEELGRVFTRDPVTLGRVWEASMNGD